jgi:hypothetical protein
MPEFTIPDFLRLVGKGPKLDEDMEPLNQKYWYYDDAISELQCIAPFADILTAWTPEKDALLLGVALEYERAHGNQNCGWYIFTDPKPGERLARAIWAAMKGGEK